MDIKNRQELHQAASEALGRAPNEKKLILTCTGVSVGLGIVFMAADLLLGKAASGSGGLSDLGRTALLQTFQSILPVVQLVFLTLWNKGYLRSMMHISRGQSADLRTVVQTFRQFGPIFRLEVLMGVIFGGLFFGCTYFGSYLYMISPFAQPLTGQMNASGSILSTETVLTDEMISAAMGHVLPMMAITLVLFVIVALPKFYSYRMANFFLLDDPLAGARIALRRSKWLMRGHRKDLLRLDLSLWWYYVLDGLVLLISEIPLLLTLLGIQLPIPDTISTYLFLGIYYVLTFLLHVWIRNFCEVIYVKAFDRLCTPDAPPQGVVLGNIFQM